MVSLFPKESCFKRTEFKQFSSHYISRTNFFTILQLNLFVYIVFYNCFKGNTDLTNTTTVYFVMVAQGSGILPYLNGIFQLESPKGTTTVSAKNHTQPARLAHESLIYTPLSHISFIKAKRKIFMTSRPHFKGIS